MQIRIRATGAVVTDGEFRAMFSNTGFPPQLTEEIINDFGGDVVFEGPQAQPMNPYQFSMLQGVEQIGDKWYTQYVLGPVFVDNEKATAAEQEAAYKASKDAEQAANIRAARNAKLFETDWVVIRAMETGAPIPGDVAATRQALRDITSQPGFPWEIVWP